MNHKSVEQPVLAAMLVCLSAFMVLGCSSTKVMRRQSTAWTSSRTLRSLNQLQPKKSLYPFRKKSATQALLSTLRYTDIVHTV